MAEAPFDFPLALVDPLLKNGGLRRVSLPESAQASERNDAWEARILSRPAGYLRDYDLLFRRVTRTLLAQGLDFGEYHPHRALAAVLGCISTVPADDIERMIRHRHALKYDRPLTPEPDAARILQQLLQEPRLR